METETESNHNITILKLISHFTNQPETGGKVEILYSIYDLLESNKSLNFWKIDVSQKELNAFDKRQVDAFVHFLLKNKFKYEEGRRPSCVQKKTKTGKEEAVTLNILQRIFCLENPPCHDILMHALKWSITQDHANPSRRRSIIQFSLKWLSTMESFDEHYYIALKDLLILMITDVWSAIRGLCVKQLGMILRKMSIKQLEQFFTHLKVIIGNPNTSWQAREGSILAINCIIQQFVKCGMTENEGCWSHFKLKFGGNMITVLPDFMTSSMAEIIYPLLADEQLSIRDNTIATFNSYLTRQSHQDVTLALKEVFEKLDALTQKTRSVGKDHMTDLDAFYAESLLGVIIKLTKILPPGSLLQHWSEKRKICSCYLEHPASSVRQTTSLLYRAIVCREADPDVTIKILKDLSCEWKVNTRNLRKAIGDSIEESWQYREGRMLTYELILKYLITNHKIYTLNIKPSSERRPSLLHQTRRQSLGNKSKSSSCSDVADTKYDLKMHEHKRKQRKSSLIYPVHYQRPPQVKEFSKSSSDRNLKSHNCDNDTSVGTSTGRDINCRQIQSLLEQMHGDFRDCIHDIYYQCVQCMADSQWELQRIAKQVLPVIAEVVRWYDISILKAIFSSDLTTNTDVLCYTSCCVLNYSIKHASDLGKSPSTLKSEAQICVKHVADHLIKEHLDTVELLLQRPVCDKLSVVVIQIILSVQMNFNLTMVQRISETTLVIQLMMQVFTRGHHEHALTSDLTELIDPQMELTVIHSGLLSCSHKNTGDELYNIHQFEKWMLTELSPLLEEWVKTLPPNQGCQLLPLLVAYCNFYSSDDLIMLAITNSMVHICDSVCKHLALSSTDHDTQIQKDANVQMVLLSQIQLTNLINQKGLDAITLKHAMDMFTLLFTSTQSTESFIMFISASYQRLQGFLPTDLNGSCQQNEDVDSDAGSDWDSWDEEDESTDLKQGNLTEYNFIKGYLVLVKDKLAQKFTSLVAHLNSKERDWLIQVLKD